MNQIAKRQSTSLPTLDGERAKVMRLQSQFRDKPDKETLTNAAQMIVAAYPNNRPSDPKSYVKTMIGHLSKYPRSVLEQIVDPRTGVITRTVYPPVVADIEEFSGPIMRRMERDLERATQTVKQLEHADPPEPTPEEKADAMAKVAKLKEDFAVSDVEAEERKAERQSRTWCNAGDAIRHQMGLEKPEEGPSE